MKRSFLIGLIYASISVAPGIAFASEQSCNVKVTENAINSFGELHHLKGEVTDMYWKWTYLSDIVAKDYVVEVSAKDSNPPKKETYSYVVSDTYEGGCFIIGSHRIKH